MRLLVAALVWGAMAGWALAAPGECSVTGYGTFACDVALDGDGLTFRLPDGRTFAFAQSEAGVGMAYVVEANAAPGQRPEELREFVAVDGKPGCWARDEDFEFCVLVAQ